MREVHFWSTYRSLCHCRSLQVHLQEKITYQRFKSVSMSVRIKMSPLWCTSTLRLGSSELISVTISPDDMALKTISTDKLCGSGSDSVRRSWRWRRLWWTLSPSQSRCWSIVVSLRSVRTPGAFRGTPLCDNQLTVPHLICPTLRVEESLSSI